MEFIVNREKLVKILSIISYQVFTKPALPILANILLETEKNNLKISATNLELGVIFNIQAKTKKTGKITLPTKTLTDFISTLNQEEVAFKLENSEMEIKTRTAVAKLPTISAEEYPAIPKVVRGVVEMEGERLTKILERLIFAASVDASRPILTGVLVEFSKKEVKLVATDGYRLSFERVDVDSNSEEKTVVIPGKTLSQLVRVVAEEKTTVKILQDPSINQVGFEVGGVYLVSRLVDGTFPDWQKIIPSSFKTTVKLSKAEFLQAVRVGAVFAKEAGNTVTLNLSNQLEIKAQSGLGTSNIKVPAKISGDNLEIAFNWRYLQEALQAIPGDEVEINLVESLAPAKFTPGKPNTDFFHIVMPVRV